MNNIKFVNNSRTQFKHLSIECINMLIYKELLVYLTIGLAWIRRGLTYNSPQAWGGCGTQNNLPTNDGSITHTPWKGTGLECSP